VDQAELQKLKSLPLKNNNLKRKSKRKNLRLKKKKNSAVLICSVETSDLNHFI